MQRNFDGVLFDLDGTLLDTRDLIVESYQHTFRCHLDRDVSREEILSKFGYTLVDHFRCYPEADLDAMISTYRTYNLARHDELTIMFPDVKESLQQLSGLGCRLGIVSSKARQTVLKGLELFDLRRYFSAIVCFEDTARHKPHPDPVTLGRSLLGLEAPKAVMVGDSPFDIAAARAAGVKAAAVGWSCFPEDELARERPDYILREIGEIIAIVQS